MVGGGHAGLEAALASARLGAETLLITLSRAALAALSCNPAFGGPAKGGLVREIDALGGAMGLAADRAAVQCRVLGASRGAMARATRNQVTRGLYQRAMTEIVAAQERLTLFEGEAVKALTSGGRISGLRLAGGREFSTYRLVLAGGTFWRGRLFHGQAVSPGGRAGEPPAEHLSGCLAGLGHSLGRLTTNTPPRLQAGTVNLAGLSLQPGDPEAEPFSMLSERPRNIHNCYLTYTNERTHEVVRKYLKTSALYSGAAPGAGPRYCPSIEDKVTRFPDKTRHQIFIEPDEPGWLFPNGLTTGLSPEAQALMIATVPGLERAVIARPGYAIEYDFVNPVDLDLTLESKLCPGLYLAGQVNGTSGYEEAGAQGILAGLNAGLAALGRPPLILTRDQALIGVMVDDLTGVGVVEPYRMFTSRAEWRLLLREDNADSRLSPLALELGALDEARQRRWLAKKAQLETGRAVLQQRFSARELAPALEQAGHGPLRESLSLAELLRRPEISLADLRPLAPALAGLEARVSRALEVEIKFAGYLNRQKEQVARLSQMENVCIPVDFDYASLSGLSNEAVEKLRASRPSTLGQASRIPGLTPAAISILAIFVGRRGRFYKKRNN